MTAETQWLQLVNGLANGLYDRHLGWLLGHRFVQLTHVGRRSGRRYRTVLEVVEYDRSVPEFVVSGFGRRSDWLRNLASPRQSAASATPTITPWPSQQSARSDRGDCPEQSLPGARGENDPSLSRSPETASPAAVPT
jgi:deazaflavin-dependent oxidoreductase (nitroreductase family)